MATMEQKSVRRREDARLLTGSGNYVGDPRPDGLVHAVLLRSPHAHATIGPLDVSHARAVPGVIDIVTHADLTDVHPIPGGIGFPRPDGSPAPKTDRALLAHGRVRFVGEPVALVLADTRAAAQEAAEAILVEYDPLPLVTEPRAALAPGAPAVWEDVPDNTAFLWQRGDSGGGGGRARMRRPCDDARLLGLPRYRQFDGAPRGLGRGRTGWPARRPRLPPVALRPAQRPGQRQLQAGAHRYPGAGRGRRRLVRHEIRHSPGGCAGRLGCPPPEPPGPLDC